MRGILHKMAGAVLLFALIICAGCGQAATPVNSDKPQTVTETPEIDSKDRLTETPVISDVPEQIATPTPTEPPHEHAYTESISKEATCTEAGEKTFACECGDTYVENIEVAGHNYEVVADSAINATCETDGKEADTKCSVCSDVVSGAVIPATGHGYGDYVSNNDATYTADGTETATCVCGLTDTRTAEGSKLEYTYTDLSQTMYAKSSVNVRNLPSTDGEKIGGLSKAQKVTVTGQCKETEWYRIEYNGAIGYVSNDYIQKDKPVVATPTPKPTPTPVPVVTPTPGGYPAITNTTIGNWKLREDGVYYDDSPICEPGSNITEEWIGKTIAEYCEAHNVVGLTFTDPWYRMTFMKADRWGDYVIGSCKIAILTYEGQEVQVKIPF